MLKIDPMAMAAQEIIEEVRGYFKVTKEKAAALDTITSPKLLAKLKRMREALEFYARLDVYMAPLKDYDTGFDYERTDVHLDSGKIARKALEEQ